MSLFKPGRTTRRPTGFFYMLSAFLLAVGATAGSFALLGSTAANAASGPDAVSGSAYGLGLTLAGSTLVPPTPSVTLPATGADTTSSIVTIPTNPVIDAAVATVDTNATNATLASEVVNGSSDVASAALLNSLVPAVTSVLSADAIHSVCTSSATGSVGGTTIASLVIDGMPIPVTDAVDQIPAIPAPLSGVLNIEINKQVVTNSAGATGITVDALVVTLLSSVLTPGGAVLTLGQSVCGATGPDINAAPTVSGISPNSGPTAGGTTVTITGTGFNCVTGVTFGTTAAAGYTVNSPTSITATSPPGAVGTVDVTVKNCNGTSPTGTFDEFTYVATSSGATAPTAPVAPLATPVAVTG
jgi:hypothetical protein